MLRLLLARQSSGQQRALGIIFGGAAAQEVRAEDVPIGSTNSQIRSEISAAMGGLPLPSHTSKDGVGKHGGDEVCRPQVDVGEDGLAIVDGWAQAEWHDWIESKVAMLKERGYSVTTIAFISSGGVDNAVAPRLAQYAV